MAKTPSVQQMKQVLAKGGKKNVHAKPSIDQMNAALTLRKASGGLVPSVEPAVHSMKRGKGTGAEFMRELASTPGVKANELLARNLDSLNSLPKMTREEFAGHLAKNPLPKLKEEYSSENKYKQYSMPGGDNYREMLLTMPAKSTPMSYEDWVNKGRIGSFDFNEDKQYDPEYQSPHFSHPNIIAHARLKDRNINGKKVLHADEIQSDWHQEGRKSGYIDKDLDKKQKEAQLKTKKSKLMAEKIRALSDENKDNIELMQAYMKHHGEYLKAREEEDALRNLQINGVPDAPFKKDWHELALKHLINHAVENGYDTLAVTPGDVHSKRFDLSEHIDRIEYDPIKKHLVGFKNDDPVYEGTVEPQDLGKEIGVDAAHKILKEPSHTLGSYKVLEGKDLSIGGVGMKKFYDKIIPEAMNKIGKQHGAKVYQLPEGGVNLHAMDITPAMREHVKKHGLPMFADGGTVDITSVGANEAPDLDVKVAVPLGGDMNMGGVDLDPVQHGTQFMPTPQPQQGVPNQNAPQMENGFGQPQMPQHPNLVAGNQPPQINPPAMPPQPASNILQMTRQGQSMAALKPQAQSLPQMAQGGKVKGTMPNIDAMRLALTKTKKAK